MDSFSSALHLLWSNAGKVHYVALWTNRLTILLFFTVYMFIFWRCWALEWRIWNWHVEKLCLNYTGYILTKSINLYYINFLPVINRLKSLALKRFDLSVRGMYVEVMYQALKNTFNGNPSEQIVSFFFKNQSQLVSFIRIYWFYISSLTLLFQKLNFVLHELWSMCKWYAKCLILRFSCTAYQTWHERQIFKDKKEDGKLYHKAQW